MRKSFAAAGVFALVAIGGSVSAQVPPLPNSGSDAEFSDSATVSIKKPLLPQPNANSVPGVRWVEVIGLGDTAESARRDAARLAVQQVSGLFIDNRRRVELNISDRKVTEVVDEKILSYTNGYVSQFDLISTDSKDGQYAVKARVGVSVAPLLKVLQDNQLPVVPFDAVSASATAGTLGDEKAAAINIYEDLADRISTIMTVAIGSPQVDTSLPSSPDEAWLRIPLTLKFNSDFIAEWQTKLALIAQSRATFKISRKTFEDTSFKLQGCKIVGTLLFQPYHLGKPGEIFRAPEDGNNLRRVIACFAASNSTNDVDFQCYSRDMAVKSTENCRKGRPCIGLHEHISKNKSGDYRGYLGISLDFLDQSNAVIKNYRYEMTRFPGVEPHESFKKPYAGQPIYVDACPVPQDMLVRYMSNGGGDLLFFPPPGHAIRAYAYVLMKNSQISQISAVKSNLNWGR